MVNDMLLQYYNIKYVEQLQLACPCILLIKKSQFLEAA